MIYDNLNNISRYQCVGMGLYELLLTVKGLKKSHPVQIQQLKENSFCKIEKYETKTNFARCEEHFRYCDIQYPIDGLECVSLCNPTGSTQVSEEQLSTDLKIHTEFEVLHKFVIGNGFFLILFPGELHIPCQAIDKPQLIKKCTIKYNFTK